MADQEQLRHKITLSLPRETWQAITELARDHQRSFTKELIWALQEYVRHERQQTEKQP
jgi:5-methylcytosine-specific restriction endonuclease McrA